MGNMSYCKFQNTDQDLLDCQETLESLFNGDTEEPLSREELSAAKRLVIRCTAIVNLFVEYEGLDSAADVDEKVIYEVLDEIHRDAEG